MTTAYLSELNYNAPSDTTSCTRLQGRWLTIARSIWLVLVILAVSTFALALPIYFDQLRTVAVNDLPARAQLTPSDQAALAQLGLSVDFYAIFLTGLQIVVGIIVALISLVIFWHKSDDGIAILTSLLLMLTATYGGLQHPLPAVLVSQHPDWYRGVYFLYSVYFFVITLFLGVFPDGRFVPIWTRWLMLIPLGVGLIPAIFPTSAFNYIEWSLPLFLLYTALTYGGLFYAQLYRYRRTSFVTQRQQTKWVVFGSVVAFLVVITLPLVIFSVFSNNPAMYQLSFQTVISGTALIFAVSVSLSVLRYRLWDIDLVIHRSLVYGGLTILLVLVFAGSVFLAQRILQFFTGGMQSPVALAMSALVIGGLFQPARRRLQSFVDRRFYHLRVNLNQFAAQPAPITNPGALTGIMLGVYQVQEPIGRGGMGEVYKGFHPGLNRTVAVKILPATLADNPEFRARFEREAKTVAALRHPNIVHVFDFGQMDGIYYMVMEYVDGEELNKCLKQGGRLSLEAAYPLIHDIASALDYAHEQGLVHRDVKPSNVMLQPVTDAGRGEYRAVLMDFGIAKIRDAHTGLTGTGLIGTLDYAAPEQIMAAKTVTRQADIYALGIMVYQMLTGQLPFKSDNIGALVFAHLNQPAPDPRSVVPDLPEEAAEAIEKALAKKPEDRFQTAGEFAHALQAATLPFTPVVPDEFYS